MGSDKAIVAVIFSKDRAMQLDACLRSFAMHCRDIDQCVQRVLYACSHQRSEAQYESLRKSHPQVEFIREKSFHSDLIQAMEGFSHVLFLVDDNLFVREWSLRAVLDALQHNEQALGFSLRLGKNTSFCYSLNTVQKFPDFHEIAPDVLRFCWATAAHDFGYPLEVSSSIYSTEQVLPLIRTSPTITNPNSLEACLDTQKDRFRKTHGDLLCFATSVAFCNPVNIVQIGWLNRCRDEFGGSVHALMRKFDLGYRIDLRPFVNFLPKACHQEVEFVFISPPAEWASLAATVELKSKVADSTQVDEAAGVTNDISAACSLTFSELSQKERDYISELASTLNTEQSNSAWLLSVLKMFDDVSRDELVHVQSMTVVLKERVARLNQLVTEAEHTKHAWYEPEILRLNQLVTEAEHTKHAWYEPEILRLNQLVTEAEHTKHAWYEPEILRLNRLITEKYEPELARLQAEMATVGHQLVRKLRHMLMNRAPRVFYFIRHLVQLGRYIWRQQKKIAQAMRARINTRLALNLPWPIKRPLVSIVIASFNYGKYLHETIDSVLAQTFQDLEIIVVDDGSTDPYTREVLATLDKPKTRVIVQENQGLPKTRNNGIRMARGKYICCLDSDDCLKPTYLEKCIYQLETRNLDVCFSWVQIFGESNGIWETGPFLLDLLMKGNSVSVSAVFKKTLWKRVGGYKEAMTHGYDDWEFWLTLAERGAIGHCIPEPLMLHRKHSVSMSAGRKHRYDKIVENIKSLHPKLYKNQSYVRKIRKRQERTFTVFNPLSNLLRRRRTDARSNVHRIRILLPTPWFDLGGASVVKKDVFTHLKPKGVKATAIATNPSCGAYTDNGLQLYEAITEECFDLPRFLDGQNKIQFVEYLIKSRDIQLLYLAGSRIVYEMLPALKKALPGLRVIDELYNTVGHVASNREFSKFIDLNIVINEEIRQHLISLGESESRIQVIAPGIDSGRFHRDAPAYSEAAAYRPYRQFTFGFLGRLSPEKRPQDFVRLAAQLPSCQFRIAGDGPSTGLIAEQIAAERVSERCHLEGSTDNPLAFLAGIDALVITSEVEGLPVVLLEAMALELPVITTVVGGIPQVVVHGENGLLYKPCQIDELTSLSDMLSQMSMTERKAIGRSARETVLSGYTIEICAAKYLTAFERLYIAS